MCPIFVGLQAWTQNQVLLRSARISSSHVYVTTDGLCWYSYGPMEAYYVNVLVCCLLRKPVVVDLARNMLQQLQGSWC